MQIDSTDKKIIDIFKKNSRESFATVGTMTSISESAVRRRVKNMLDAGVIKKFTIEQDDVNSTKAIVLVSVDSATDTSLVSTNLKKLKDIRTVYEITGQYDIAVIMSADNISSINESIDALRKKSGVVDTNTVIILRTV
ncbi:MAG: AsnC family transcriptional regulator [Cenarchaeum symbiont of Oopsacas minuta]|nr:AsnC family transcriptional regulator [Cenarchaeum symbiont of Oopsacas minuta]